MTDIDDITITAEIPLDASLDRRTIVSYDDDGDPIYSTESTTVAEAVIAAAAALLQSALLQEFSSQGYYSGGVSRLYEDKTSMTTLTDERRKLGAEMNDLWNSITSRAIDHALAVYDRGYADGQADLLTKRSAGRSPTPPRRPACPGRSARRRRATSPTGPSSSRCPATAWLTACGRGPSPTPYARYRVISLPDPEPDPDQPILDALAASGLTEAQARDALDAITAIAVIEPRAE